MCTNNLIAAKGKTPKGKKTHVSVMVFPKVKAIFLEISTKYSCEVQVFPLNEGRNSRKVLAIFMRILVFFSVFTFVCCLFFNLFIFSFLFPPLSIIMLDLHLRGHVHHDQRSVNAKSVFVTLLRYASVRLENHLMLA